jgi:hypothetical protein
MGSPWSFGVRSRRNSSVVPPHLSSLLFTLLCFYFFVSVPSDSQRNVSSYVSIAGSNRVDDVVSPLNNLKGMYINISTRHLLSSLDTISWTKQRADQAPAACAALPSFSGTADSVGMGE